MPPKTPPRPRPLEAEELLEAEFEYIAQAAFQANEDRARVSSFYLVAVGSLVAALFSTQLLDGGFDPRFVAFAFSALLFVLTLLGTLTTLQLARLRLAWYEAALAMNQLKEYWIRHAQDKNLESAFRWNTSTLPPVYKTNSISFYQTVEVAMLSGLTFGAAVYFFQQGLGHLAPTCHWAYAFASALLAFLLQLFFYKRLVKK